MGEEAENSLFSSITDWHEVECVGHMERPGLPQFCATLLSTGGALSNQMSHLDFLTALCLRFFSCKIEIVPIGPLCELKG